MRIEEFFVVSEEWFDENENPSIQAKVVDACTTLADAQDSMESFLRDFEEDNIGEGEGKDWTCTNDEKMSGRYKLDDSRWYEVKITHIKKTYDDEGYLDTTEID